MLCLGFDFLAKKEYNYKMCLKIGTQKRLKRANKRRTYMGNFRGVMEIIVIWALIIAALIVAYPMMLVVIEAIKLLWGWAGAACNAVASLWDLAWSFLPESVSRKKDFMWEFILFAIAAIMLKDGVVALLGRHESSQYEEKIE